MNIDSIKLIHVRVPLVEPFRISNGSVSEKDAIIVKVKADGITGYGEASPMSGGFYSDDTPESVWKMLVNDVIPAVLASRDISIESLNRILQVRSRSSFASAGIETALWDIEAQKQSTPLFAQLGGSRRCIESGLAVGIYPTIPALLDAIGRYLSDGYKRLKIKIQPGWDVVPLAQVRCEFGDIPLMVDANCAYTRADIDHLRALDEFGMMMIEQPLAKDDLAGHALLQSLIRTPVCLDESAKNAGAVHEAIRLKSCKIINIKIQRVGGLQNAKEIHDLCAEAGIPVWAGTMPELGIGAVQTLHLASLPNFVFPTDVESSLRWFTDDIVRPLIDVRNGVIVIAEGSGNGYHPARDVIQSFKVNEIKFSGQNRVSA
ncbi:MAG TPA: o-succinylbenzoate synthase [Bacteroidota bacterium]|nr:o-succinylbenzoate synthase [Bacteroidota bacterium]